MTLRIAVFRPARELGLGAFAEPLASANARLTLADEGVLAVPPSPEAFDAALVLGGLGRPERASLLAARRWVRDAVLQQVPVLGVGLGGRLLAASLGGRPAAVERPAARVEDLFVTDAGLADPVFGALPRRIAAVAPPGAPYSLPRHAVPLAGSLTHPHEAFRFGASAYALQLHLEQPAAAAANAWRVEGTVPELAPAEDAMLDAARVLVARWLDVARAESATRRWRLRVPA